MAVTVADFRAQFRAQQGTEQVEGEASPAVCVGGKRLPQDGSIPLSDLDIDLNAPAKYCSPEEYLSCSTEAELKTKPPPQLGLEKYLTLWILLAVALGVSLGQIPGVGRALHAMKVGNTNLLTALGMIVMLLPPFAAVKYDELLLSLRSIPKRIAVGSVLVNWVIGPFMMLFIAHATLKEHAALLQGVIYIGAARCIAMVLVWSAIAGGDQFLCVSLVLLNSLITVVTYAPMVTFLGFVAHHLGAQGLWGEVSFVMVLTNVLIYLGIPLFLGVLMWAIGRSRTCFRRRFLPRFAPCGLLALLWTVVMMFAEMSQPLLSGQVGVGNIFLVCVPLLTYFLLMFFLSWGISRYILSGTLSQSITFAFTAASNNFELALAACTAIFGSSNQAVATVLGPLLEIPVMLALVKVAKCLAREPEDSKQSTSDEGTA